MTNRKKEKKVHVNKYANVNGLGKKEIVKYRSILEELCCAKANLEGLMMAHEIDSGKTPSRKQYHLVKELYRQNILQNNFY